MGKLIVLEGTDGCGKSTQVRLLTERLSKEGKAFVYLLKKELDSVHCE